MIARVAGEPETGWRASAVRIRQDKTSTYARDIRDLVTLDGPGLALVTFMP